ncbi:MAG TPA: hypothetical protein VJ499_06100, partial [Flavisolibacter sp.]|nr:hypothetical protein [Flavisolibacter sp.]
GPPNHIIFRHSWFYCSTFSSSITRDIPCKRTKPQKGTPRVEYLFLYDYSLSNFVFYTSHILLQTPDSRLPAPDSRLLTPDTPRLSPLNLEH